MKAIPPNIFIKTPSVPAITKKVAPCVTFLMSAIAISHRHRYRFPKGLANLLFFSEAS